MRAWELHGNREMVIGERSIPEPESDEVRVRVAFTGICGTDLHEYYDGPVVTTMDEHPRTGVRGPIVPGHESSGVIDAVGGAVEGLRVGDHVAIEPVFGIEPGSTGYNVDAAFYGYHAHGFLAEYAVVKATSIHVLPGSVSLRDGALVEPLSVAVHAVRRAGVSAGFSVVVFGGGPIGLGLSLVLRAEGIHDAIVVEPSEPRAAALRALALDVVHPDELVGTPGRLDVVFDAAGAQSVADAGLRLLKPGGTYMLVATYPHGLLLDGMAMIGRELSVVAVNAYDRGDFDRTIELLEGGLLDTQGWVDQVPFDDAVSVGYPRLREALAAKVLVEIGGEQ